MLRRLPVVLTLTALMVCNASLSRAEDTLDVALKCTGFFVLTGYNKMEKEWVISLFANGRADFDGNIIEYETTETSVKLKWPSGCSAGIVRRDEQESICYYDGTLDRVSGKVDFTMSSISAMKCDSSTCTAWAERYYSGKCTVAQRLF